MVKDFSKLSGRIVEKFVTQSNFAVAMGLSERSISLKLNGKVNWKDDEIEKAITLLELNVEDIPVYFFTRKVQAS